MNEGYWLQTSEVWDRPPEGMKEYFFDHGYQRLDPGALLDLGSRQFVHTSRTEAFGTYKGFDFRLIPGTVAEQWWWMKTGEPVPLYAVSKEEIAFRRPKEKLGIYDGELEIRERVPAQCMTIASFCSSLLKMGGTPSRLRVGFSDYTEQASDPLFKHHNQLEYWDSDSKKWVMTNPTNLQSERRFMHSYEAIKMIDENPKLIESFQLPNVQLPNRQLDRDYTVGIRVVARALVEDILALYNEPTTPWRVDRQYHGVNLEKRDFKSLGTGGRNENFEELKEDLLHVAINPAPEELGRVKSQGIVSYELRERYRKHLP